MFHFCGGWDDLVYLLLCIPGIKAMLHLIGAWSFKRHSHNPDLENAYATCDPGPSKCCDCVTPICTCKAKDHIHTSFRLANDVDKLNKILVDNEG